jgi:hypothetical protein
MESLMSPLHHQALRHQNLLLTTSRTWWGRIINCRCILCMIGVNSFYDFNSCGVDKVDVASSGSVAYRLAIHTCTTAAGCRLAGHIDLHEGCNM